MAVTKKPARMGLVSTDFTGVLMKIAFLKKIAIVVIFLCFTSLLINCTTLKPYKTSFFGADPLPNNVPQVIEPTLQDVSTNLFEKEVLPHIIDQIDDTARAYFYDIRMTRAYNENLERPEVEFTKAANYIVGENETGGVCMDYAIHFFDNYKGPGDVYLLDVSLNGDASLRKKVKPFEKNDIVINDIKTIEAFNEETYHWIINSHQHGSYFKWENYNWDTFYTKTINGIIYWSETEFDLNTPLVPFIKEHIVINITNYYEQRSIEKTREIDSLYNRIKEINDSYLNSIWNILRPYQNNWHMETIHFYTCKDGNITLLDVVSIPVPDTHAGFTEKEKFFNHAWVRIIWNGITIDIDPTWYDLGFEQNEIIEIISF